MQIPVRSNGADLGTMDEFDVRDVLRRHEGHIMRASPGRPWFAPWLVLHADAPLRTRALCNTSTRSAMSPTQQEELYQGSRKEHTDGPVTKVLTVVRKIRGAGLVLDEKDIVRCQGELQNWGETERFPRGRYNERAIPQALFRSEAAWRANKTGSGISGS